MSKPIDFDFEKVIRRMKTKKWQRKIEKSDKILQKQLEKLHEDSQIDPKLLDEPATI